MNENAINIDKQRADRLNRRGGSCALPQGEIAANRFIVAVGKVVATPDSRKVAVGKVVATPDSRKVAVGKVVAALVYRNSVLLYSISALFYRKVALLYSISALNNRFAVGYTVPDCGFINKKLRNRIEDHDVD